MQPSMKPNIELMQKHLEHLFDGFLDGCHEGLIEIAWTDTADGKLRHAKLYGTDQIDEAVVCAADQNSIAGQNVYVGAALRKQTAANDHRASDSDILALTAYYVDIDDREAAATAKQKYKDCFPTCVVVTGRIPHMRAQLWWRLETPERDLNRARAQNAALAAGFGGDRSVVNPSRVMRLAGSIAWPAKPGRVAELTELHLFADGRLKFYPEGKIAKTFPTIEDVPPQSSTLNIGTLDGLSVDAALQIIKSGQSWHNNVLRLVAHWISRGWSDAEIITASESFTLNGYTVTQTRRDVARMVTGARAKWAIPDPENKLDVLGSQPLRAAFIEDLNISMLPRRQWLLGRTLLIGHLSLLVAPGGIGKTTFGTALGVSVVTGLNILGLDVHETGKVWIYNNEDDGDEMKRRLAAVLQHHNIPLSAIQGRLAMSTGAERPLLVAKIERNKTVVRQPDVAACVEIIKANNIKLFIVDPLVETHEAEENSNEQMKVVAGLYREIARLGNCAVLVIHHTAKPQQGTSDGHAGNMNTSRGASALTGVARVVQTIFSMGPKDAERYGIPEEDRPLYARVDDAKANLSLASADARWYQRVSVTIANGDEVGVLKPVSLTPVSSSVQDKDFLKTVMEALLTHNKEKNLTLNSAAKNIAWSNDNRFHKYRETDARGYQKATRPLRSAVMDACRAKITINTAEGVEGFTVDTTITPITLRRFCTPVNPLSQPEFMENENETVY